MDENRQQNDEDGAQDSKSKAKQLQKSGSSASNTPRKRVSQACDRCRSRKDKCDGKKPVCSTCAAQDLACSYDPATKKRGLPEGYVRGLEKLWGLSIREVEGLEDDVLGVLTGEVEPSTFESLSGVWNDREGPGTLLKTWRDSRISRELERLLPVLDSPDEKTGKRKRPESGPLRPEAPRDSKPQAPQQLGAIQATANENYYTGQEEAQGYSQHSPQRRRVDDIAVASSQSPSVSSAVPSLPTRAWRLLDIFFSYTHCWLPIVEKHDVLRVSYQYTGQGLNISTNLPGSGDHAALWSILAYAECTNLAFDKRDTQDDSHWTVDSLYKQARSLIPDEDGVFELGHVQALLILALMNMGRNCWQKAWLLIGHAVRGAMNLGLGDRCEDGTPQYHPIDRKSRTQHVFLGCFALDTLIAARMGRRPQLRKEDADSIGMLEEDGLDEWNPWTDSLGVQRRAPDGPRGPTAVLSTFNQLIMLLKILNSVICDVSNGHRRVEKCKEFLEELDSWGQVLPVMFATTKPPLLPHRYNLHLAHVSTIAAVYSRIAPVSKEMLISDQTVVDTFATTARQVMWLLYRQSENFGLLIAPPTYEYFAKVAHDCANKVPNNVPDDALSYRDWELNMERCLAIMQSVWPAVAELRTAFPVKPASTPSDYYTPNLQQLQRTASYDMPEQRTSTIPHHAKHPSSTTNTMYSFAGAPPLDSPLDARDFGSTLTHAHTNSSNPYNSNPGPYDPLLNLASSANIHSGLVDASSPGWPIPLPPTSASANDPGQGLFPDALAAAGGGGGGGGGGKGYDGSGGGGGGSIDGDSMFNDFATLDAMEWYVLFLPTYMTKLYTNTSAGATTGTNPSSTSASPNPNTSTKTSMPLFGRTCSPLPGQIRCTSMPRQRIRSYSGC